MSLRSETFRTYRSLYRSVQLVARQSSLSNKDGLVAYVSRRFHDCCESNRQLLSAALNDVNTVSTEGRYRVRQERQVIIQFERYLSQCIDQSRQVAQMMYAAVDSVELMSILQVLSAGIGNQAYRDQMEANFFAMGQHESRREARHEQTEEETSERQNRILQMAVLPYAEKLLLAHRAALPLVSPSIAHGTTADRDVPQPTPLSSWQMSEALVGSRVGVTAHRISLGHDQAVVEIDETYNKQVVYVVCRRPTVSSEVVHSSQILMDSEDALCTDGFSWEEDIERVNIAESDEVSRTIFSSSYLSRALRLCDSLERETPLHRSRKTVVVGHGVGGAVGLIVSLILLHRGFEITNAITLGAPKSLQGTLERHIAAINPIRVVLGGDPLTDYPVTGAEGQPFIHIGEILLMSPSVMTGFQDDHTNGAEDYHKENTVFSEKPMDTSPQTQYDQISGRVARLRQRYRHSFLIEHYVHHLANPNVPLTYAEGDEVWDEGDYNAMRKKGVV